MTMRRDQELRNLGGAMVWSLLTVLVHAGASSVAPLRQASVLVTVNLLVIWAWARWHGEPMFGRRLFLVPAVLLGLLFALRIAFGVLAAAMLGGGGVLILAAAAATGIRGLVRRSPVAVLAAVVALIAGLQGRDALPVLIAVLSGATCALETALRPRVWPSHAEGEAPVAAEILVAVIVLPLLSVGVGEDWLTWPDHVGWAVLVGESLLALVFAAARWKAPGFGGDALGYALPFAPPLALAIETLTSGPQGWGPALGAAVLFAAGLWLLRTPEPIPVAAAG